jgi:hypothetical protein
VGKEVGVPDFVLAGYLCSCLDALRTLQKSTEDFEGRGLRVKMNSYSVAYVSASDELVLDIVYANSPVGAGKAVIERVNKDNLGGFDLDEYKNASCLDDLIGFMLRGDELLAVIPIAVKSVEGGL